jgi:hypothetical protein
MSHRGRRTQPGQSKTARPTLGAQRRTRGVGARCPQAVHQPTPALLGTSVQHHALALLGSLSCSLICERSERASGNARVVPAIDVCTPARAHRPPAWTRPSSGPPGRWQAPLARVQRRGAAPAGVGQAGGRALRPDEEGGRRDESDSSAKNYDSNAHSGWQEARRFPARCQTSGGARQVPSRLDEPTRRAWP